MREVFARRRGEGFTLVEVVVALALMGIIMGVVVHGYVSATDRAEWSAYSLAAQSVANQGIEQVRAAKWDLQKSPIIDDLGETNFTQVERLDVPASGNPVYATNYVSVITVSTYPQLRQLRADCVWSLSSRRKSISGPFTNTAVTLRAPDQ